MNKIFLLSVMLKGVGAVLEILLQMLITGKAGVSGYGSYSTWINAADLMFWVLFSGIVKCNTFYLSGQGTSIRSFKKKYYLRYALPVLLVAAPVLMFTTGQAFLAGVVIIAALEIAVLDNSSALIARGRPAVSLVGEYVLGRLFLLCSVFLVSRWTAPTLPVLLGLYIAQYTLVLTLFLLSSKRVPRQDISHEVSLKKWGEYQKADLMHAMVEQMPVLLQYFFSGAFSAGVVSIVLLVKKLINFISGPTAKIFLPEFSRLYHAGDKTGIRNCYASIMRIQMLAVAPMAVVLLGYPQVVLGILAKELTGYAALFVGCAVIFLLVATLGPCGGILQMTGNEKTDNRCRLGALVLMVAVMLLTRQDAYFVLYGLCAQVASEAIAKYIFVCRWMGKAPTGLVSYIGWWMVPAMAIAATYIAGVQASFLWMVVSAAVVFGVGAVREVMDKENGLIRRFAKKEENRHE
jgi:O-antigen/teichoic acid export membrane protein